MKIGIIPYQEETDFVYKDKSISNKRPLLPVFQLTNKDGFVKPEDIPLNRRNFIYRPCSANPLFTELGYCCSEYPFETTGINLMDRSDGMSLQSGGNSVLNVNEYLGWRTGRSDVCIKEGTTYWEVEVINGGKPTKLLQSKVENTNEILPQKKKEINNSAPHLRLGITRREATLETPVGCDTYGYGIRDCSMESIHKGRMTQVLDDIEIKNGDIIGFLLKLPDEETQIEQAKLYTQSRIDALIEHSNDNTQNFSRSSTPLYEETSSYSISKKKSKTGNKLNQEFQKALLEYINHSDIVRDHIPIRYKNQLFFEATDYVKTTLPEYYTSNKQEREDYYKLEGSKLCVYLNGKLLGDAFTDLKPFLPPFSELQYNEKFYYNFWRHGEIQQDTETNDSNNMNTTTGTNSNPTSDKQVLLRNKYVNNNRLGYYPTISCFNGGTARIISKKEDLKYFNEIISPSSDEIKTLDMLFDRQIGEEIVWDIIDEVEEEMTNRASKDKPNNDNIILNKLASPKKENSAITEDTETVETNTNLNISNIIN